MELLENFILAKLIDVVYRALNEEVKISEMFCWADSMMTLSWIKAYDQEFETFIQTRVIFIRENVKFNLWNYVGSQDNPADLITHFQSVDLNNSLWLDGPQLLRNVEQYLDKTKFVGEATCIGKMTVKPQGNAATMGIFSKRIKKRTI